MTVLVTGAAGFIGSAVSHQLLDDGQDVVGVDDLNEAYDARLKKRRLESLGGHEDFAFHRADICVVQTEWPESREIAAAEFSRLSKWRSSIERTVQEEGVTLYAAA